MIDRGDLLSDLQKLLQRLEADLLERSESADVPEVGKTLRAEYDRAKTAERTAQNYEDWRTDAITQAAAAWVLSCVFVRFLEDNRLIDPPKIAGPEDRLARARDEHELYFRKSPQQTDRDYLLSVFDQLAKLPGTKDVFGKHNPIRELPNWLSGDAAGEMLRFFQKIDANTGLLVHDFTDPDWDTRFLGDLYQDLSEAARKKYALLQTPEFVEEFILGRTLDPALNEFGLEQEVAPANQTVLPGMEVRQSLRTPFKMIDPACGSGHFLLGAFPRILDRWQRKEPGTNVRELVQRTLNSIHGVDVNPYAVAIARFRLLLAAMRACRIQRLDKNVPGFTINLACGDSLLHAPLRTGQQVLDFELTSGDGECEHAYQSEDLPVLKRILRGAQYHTVVANPPYIVPKDRRLGERYRKRFTTCHMKYSLAVPFFERIYRLAINGGYTGQITANSFMKREFGKKLIESFLPQIDLTHVIDTSGAYIPGHGTPTVILFGRHRLPVASTLRTVMGIRGEPSTPADPAHGVVWSAIVAQVDQPGSRSECVSVSDSSRQLFNKHPWSIGGGGAAELKEMLDSKSEGAVRELVESIGPASFAGVDDAFVAPIGSLRRSRVDHHLIRPFAGGDQLRDWRVEPDEECLTPYDLNAAPLPISSDGTWCRRLWPLRRTLEGVTSFGGKTRAELGEQWWTWYRWIVDRVNANPRLVFAFVAPHNHFVLDRCERVFNRSAPILKLRADVVESDYLSLLALLNSSIACFWLKQVSQQKQLTGGDGVRVETIAKVPYEFGATQLENLPLPPNWQDSPLRHRLAQLAAEIDAIAREFLAHDASDAIIHSLRLGRDLRETVTEYRLKRELQRKAMVWLQEEIDFTTYSFYGLCGDELTSAPSPLPSDAKLIDAGERPFCILRQHNQDGFAVPTEILSLWPAPLQDLWRLRIRAINESADLRIVEDPHYKRRWVGRLGLFNHTHNKDELLTACRSWLYERLESYFDYDGRMNSEGISTARLEISLISVAHLADIARQDYEFVKIGELMRDDSAFNIQALVGELVESESVPLLPIFRYKPSGLRKRVEWERCWELQRREDAGESIGNIPLPPKYEGKDFIKSDYNRLRGKLDVPNERWISFPQCEGPDGTPVICWAGYDHLQQARAISAYYVRVQTEFGGTDDARLIPLLACLIELLPWLKQWHNEPDAAFDGMRMGDYFEGFVNEEARQLNKTIAEIKAWTPPAKAGRRGRKSN